MLGDGEIIHNAGEDFLKIGRALVRNLVRNVTDKISQYIQCMARRY